MNIKTTGRFFQSLQRKNQYDEESRACMVNTTRQLLDRHTNIDHPGMLLGKIQSGKTRTFIGIMGLAYDHGFDAVILLTKGTNALVRQTFSRLTEEFAERIESDDLRVYDIMAMPEQLRKYELSQKLAFIVKKETKNLDRIKETFFETYPDLAKRKVLFIDDEADYASVAYEHKKDQNVTHMRVLATKINELRERLTSSAFLQVTATPYSLYLQPDDRTIHENKVYQPVRPAFTELVPVHDRYVGGDLYFEKAQIKGHFASYLYHEVSEKELEAMKRIDRRKIKMDQLLTQKSITNIRSAVVNFIVGSAIRRWQQNQMDKPLEKYAMVIHTERGKEAHAWQKELIRNMEDQLIAEAHLESDLLRTLTKGSYDQLIQSVAAFDSLPQPRFDDVWKEVVESLQEEYVISTVVNSEKDVHELLDHRGELKLRAPMNIFIGGQLLDRGVTIRNMIGFFYGRNPRSFQQDTVLQHSRMYGARPLEDMAVTRFYTSGRIYDVMKQIHEFDTELRRAFERGGHKQGVVFIQKEENNQILPCSPNKIMLSSLTMIQPHKRMLPVGFQTGYKTYIQKTVRQMDEKLKSLVDGAVDEKEGAYLVPAEDVRSLVGLIHSTLEMDEGRDFHLDEYESVLDYLTTENEKGAYVWLVIRGRRKIQRFNGAGQYENSPDTPGSGKGELSIARRVAEHHPALILLRQEGKKEHGWRGTPFYWPVLVAQRHTTPTVFAKKTVKG
ncbi:Z1 domain-containing protein [Halobacillus litoralis]|uniref:Z1 domain-containing protein n=1 Tax=Halobacillus litoralis TaxID=45668 RepID=UPI001CD6D4A5|nr:Z1 domain-containing protein [Halobacillus litoralis]MCA0972044.1 Z1 domain-containing protein [Halobacillus litoralis]